MKKIIIAAVAKNGVIGRSSGEMPWHSKEDFQHFKKTTLGFPIIMGRKTFESLGKPLKDRLHIILSRNKDYNPGFDGIIVLSNLSEAYEYCGKLNVEKAFVIGGGHIFTQAVNSVDEMILSIMDIDATGDICFPDFNKDEWQITARDQRDVFEILYYARKK